MNKASLACGDVSVQRDDSGLTLEAGILRRRWAVGPRGAVTQALALSERELPLARTKAFEMECSYDGLTYLRRRRRQPWVDLTPGPGVVEQVPASRLDPAHLLAVQDWSDPRQGLTLQRRWLAIPGTSTILTWAQLHALNAPQVDFGDNDYLNLVESLPLDLAGWRVTVVGFRGQTDLTNDVLTQQELLIAAGDPPRNVHGNLLILHSPDEACGLFVLHDGAPLGERRRECSADYILGEHGIAALGWGLAPHELADVGDEWRCSSTVAIGAFDPARTSAREALRRFLQARYPLHPVERAVVVNPWGDRRLYQRLNEDFVLTELEATAAIGADVYQIDDGWQAGGVLSNFTNDNWQADASFWKICPRRFPHGFERVARRARELNIRLALWFAPDTNTCYRRWQQERDLLLDFHRRYQIDLFKIDAVRLRTHEAQRRLVAMLESIIEQSDGRVRFNLDITADRRLGYFGSLRYGNLFVENRYVMVKAEPHNNYAPYCTLRNLWRLAHYVPPEKMQFEFANLDHTVAGPGYADRSDPLDATQHAWDYLAAVTLMACPLCWFEPSDLGTAAVPAIRRVLDLHHRIKDELVGGCTLPIGAEPDGRCWTGLQCISGKDLSAGLVQVFRQYNDEPSARLPMHRVKPGQALRLQCLSHEEPDATVTADHLGVPFHIPRDRDYRLYRYVASAIDQ